MALQPLRALTSDAPTSLPSDTLISAGWRSNTMPALIIRRQNPPASPTTEALHVDELQQRRIRIVPAATSAHMTVSHGQAQAGPRGAEGTNLAR